MKGLAVSWGTGDSKALSRLWCLHLALWGLELIYACRLITVVTPWPLNRPSAGWWVSRSGRTSLVGLGMIPLFE